jgi:hypothetical protein
MMKPEPVSDHENLATFRPAPTCVHARPVPGVRGARARAMLGRSRLLEVTAIGGVSGPVSDPENP